MSVLVVALSMAPHSLAGAQEDDLPDDDGAPPEEYAPAIDARSAASSAELPSAPPVDNAFPVAGRFRSSCSDSFGDPRSGGRTHMGVDCFAPLGTALVAVEAGWIRYATPGDPFDCTTGGDISGNRVSLRGRSGYVYYYGHLDAILVGGDQPVEKGQVIGTVGRTGNAACTSPHLHFEVKCGDNGDPFDPYPSMATWGRVSLPPTRWPSTELLGAGAAFSGVSRQDLFALECGQAIRQRTWRSSDGFTPAWSGVDGVATSDPDAASPGAGWDPHVVVRGTDNAVWQLYRDGSAWVVGSLGGICSSGPSAAFSGPDRFDVFCRGGDFAIWHRTWLRESGWSGWEKVGGIATSDPDAASPGPGYPAEVVVRGTDDAVWHLYWNGSAWVVDSLGGICSSGPSAAYSGPDRLDVFCRGGDLAIWHRTWLRQSGWSGWEKVGGIAMSDPDAVSPGPGYVGQVFVRGLDRRLYQFFWNGQAWVGQIWGLT